MAVQGLAGRLLSALVLCLIVGAAWFGSAGSRLQPERREGGSEAVTIPTRALRGAFDGRTDRLGDPNARRDKRSTSWLPMALVVAALVIWIPLFLIGPGAPRRAPVRTPVALRAFGPRSPPALHLS